MRNKTNIYFLVEGILFGGFSLYGYLSYKCGSDVLCICILSHILVVLSFLNYYINKKLVNIIASYFYILYSIIIGIYLALVVLLLSYNRMVSISLSFFILLNCYISYNYRLKQNKSGSYLSHQKEIKESEKNIK
jgi:asparagine N-glycosylation enzyme membrane subunit Stt3